MYMLERQCPRAYYSTALKEKHANTIFLSHLPQPSITQSLALPLLSIRYILIFVTFLLGSKFVDILAFNDASAFMAHFLKAEPRPELLPHVILGEQGYVIGHHLEKRPIVRLPIGVLMIVFIAFTRLMDWQTLQIEFDVNSRRLMRFLFNR
jgi:hypothetical protein